MVIFITLTLVLSIIVSGVGVLTALTSNPANEKERVMALSIAAVTSFSLLMSLISMILILSSRG